MNLFIQIPCYNEEKTLEKTISDIPEKIEGIDEIKIIVIDDGSTDRTFEIARTNPRVYKVIQLHTHQGLAKAFMTGINVCLSEGADIIVNTDGDNQYYGGDIEKLIKPILKKEADVVIGDRETQKIKHFSILKKFLQKFGSSVISFLSGTKIPDATSGFRAFSRESALRIHVFSKYTYTLETILQLVKMNFKIVSVKIRVNPKQRESRLIKSIPDYVFKSAVTIFMIFYIYNPLKLFIFFSLLFGTPGIILYLRFFYFFFTKEGPTGHIQSLIIGTGFLLFSFLMLITGLIASLISTNRQFLENLSYEIKKIKYSEKKEK